MSVPFRLLAALLLALLGGCASAPVTRYYVLSATAQVTDRPADTSVVIKDLRLPQYLDRQQIVTRGSEHRLQFAENALWAGDLRQDLTRVLTENLGRLLGSRRIVAAPHALRQAPEYRVEVEALRFERLPGGPVVLSARWWLTSGADAALLASPLSTLTGQPLASDATYDAVVASMSAVCGQLAQEIERSIRSHRPAGK